MALDKDGNLLAVPKPEGKKKSSKGKASPKGSKLTTPVVPVGESKERSRTEINNANRNFGKSIEKSVAKITGGERTVGSGAFKHSNRNLTGDVEVRDSENVRDIVKIECKGVAVVTPSGDKSFTLKKSVLDQAVSEADTAGEVGVVWLHWKNAEYGADDFAIMQSKHFLRFLEWARLGAVLERKGITYANGPETPDREDKKEL